MPNFAEGTLSDERVKDICPYIRTFKSNAPELKDVPTLNAAVRRFETGEEIRRDQQAPS